MSRSLPLLVFFRDAGNDRVEDLSNDVVYHERTFSSEKDGLFPAFDRLMLYGNRSES